LILLVHGFGNFQYSIGQSETMLSKTECVIMLEVYRTERIENWIETATLIIAMHRFTPIVFIVLRIHTYCDTGPRFLRSYLKKIVILTSKCCTLGEGAITTYFKRLRFDAAGMSGARTHDLPFAKQEHYH
jgi:predicted ferric reductase